MEKYCAVFLILGFDIGSMKGVDEEEDCVGQQFFGLLLLNVSELCLNLIYIYI